ncbi:excisionase family DNA-binding protein [Myxococcota bacterium]|nr:excisionase family DNA-binding protein [Myxococcota bacterium]
MTGRRAVGSAPAAFYSTHQVAGMLGVSLATVVNWTRLGRLHAHRTPGGHRRISRDEVLRFCQEHRYPVPTELAGAVRATRRGPPRVLILHRDLAWAELVSDYLRFDRELEITVTDRPLEAGFRLAQVRPHLVLLDLELGDVPARALARLADELDPRPLLVGSQPVRGADGEALLAEGTLAGVVVRSTAIADLCRRLLDLLPAE